MAEYLPKFPRQLLLQSNRQLDSMAGRRILTRTGDDDDEEKLSGKSILPVTSEKVIDDSFVPATGEDYLLMVR
jgi:hypothetical protein